MPRKSQPQQDLQAAFDRLPKVKGDPATARLRLVAERVIMRCARRDAEQLWNIALAILTMPGHRDDGPKVQLLTKMLNLIAPEQKHHDPGRALGAIGLLGGLGGGGGVHLHVHPQGDIPLTRGTPAARQQAIDVEFETRERLEAEGVGALGAQLHSPPLNRPVA